MKTRFSFIGSEPVRHHLGILALAACVFFINLGTPQLWDDDEPRNSQCAKEMLARRDLIVPTFNETLRIDKPVLLYWLMMGAYSLFGESEFAARIWSAALGTGTLLTTYRIGTKLFSPTVGWWSALMLGASLMFAVSSRAATPDATLIFFTTLGMYAWAVHSDGKLGRLPAYVCFGLGVLAKGPVGIVLPLAACGLHALLSLEPPLVSAIARPSANRQQAVVGAVRLWLAWLAPSRLWRASKNLSLFSGLALAAVVALPWYVLAGIETDGEWLRGFLGRHNIGRFTTAMEGHSGPFFYYIPALLAGFFPWSIFLGLATLFAWRRLRTPGADRASWRFIVCWAGAYVGFFSLSSTKLPSYVLPAYPAIAIATAAFVQHWRTNPASVRTSPVIVALASLIVVGIGVAVALPIAAQFLLPGEGWLGVLGLPLVVGGGWGLALFRQRRYDAVLRTLAATGVAFSACLFGVGAPAVSRHANARSLMTKIGDASGESRAANLPPIGAFRYSAPSLVFYANRSIRYFDDASAAAEFLVREREAYLIVPNDRLEELQAMLPDDVAELSREQRFLRRKDLVLLGRRTATARLESPAAKRR